jgi:competence protein ComEC
VKLPAVALAAAFAGGIAIGLLPCVAARAGSRELVPGLFVFTTIALFAGAILAARNALWSAAAASLGGWIFLGITGACIAQQPRAADDVISMVDRGRLDLRTPLRWHGHLRDEPAALPWGYGYEVELSGVEFRGEFLPLHGGLRVGFSPPSGADGRLLPGPSVGAGDEITLVTDARQPQVFRDEGAFNRRAYLAGQNIALVATLRAPELLERVAPARRSAGIYIARARRRLRDEVDVLFATRPEVAGVLRAMLLGDRSFVDRAESADFQRAGTFHVLVVAGLHVGAIAYLLFWIGRRLRLSVAWTTALTLTLLLAYVAMVEQRPPVLRAALMASLVALGAVFFRRLDLLNSAAAAALILLIAQPVLLMDASFQLTFATMGCIAGVAAPWLELRVQPYVHALRGWRDVTRDGTFAPRVAQFRIDLRSLLRWGASAFPQRLTKPVENSLAAGIGMSLWLFELLVITVVLQMGMQPLMTSTFHRVTLAAPLVNLLAVPLMGLMVPMGFLTILSGLLFPAMGRILAVGLARLTMSLLATVKYFGVLGHGSYRVPAPPAWLTMFFFAMGILVVVALRLHWRWSKFLGGLSAMGLLLAGTLIAIFPFPPQRHPGQLELTVLDVGQGDSLFLVSPGGKTLLIDGGGAFSGFPGKPENNGIDPGEEAVSPYLWSRGFKHIDYVAVTHGHQDHVGGLTAVLENFSVGTLCLGREIPGSAQERLAALARRRGVTIAHEVQGEKMAWDGAHGEVLWPDSAAGDSAGPAKNNDSIVMRWEFGGRAFLLPGDAEKQVERQILNEAAPEALRADVLKVGHHGSKNSTTEDFLAAVHPRVAVISAGENNPYGHPSPQLLQRLQDAGVRVLRTDRDGAVHIFTDGKSLQISCFVACPEPQTPSTPGQAPPPQH